MKIEFVKISVTFILCTIFANWKLNNKKTRKKYIRKSEYMSLLSVLNVSSVDYDIIRYVTEISKEDKIHY
jgi:hypothetical protein